MKKLNEKNKKILNIVTVALQACIILIAIILSIIVIVNPPTDSAKVAKGPIKLLPVLTDSMVGNNKTSFNPGDMIIAKTPKDVNNLKDDKTYGEGNGDIITFKALKSGQFVLNSHRIIDKRTVGTVVQYQTKGDNEEKPDEDWVSASQVLAVYSGKIKGIGKTINWMQVPKNFLLVIILPLAVLTLYNVYLLVRMIIQHRLGKIEEKVQLEATAAGALTEEEIERRVAEKLALMQEKTEEKDNSSAEIE